MEFDNGGIPNDLPAHFFDFPSSNLPKLPGAKLGVFELFNQGSFHCPVFDAEHTAPHIPQNRRNGQSLHPLSAPRGIDFPGVSAPEVFRVILEKHGVQLSAKSVYIKILQIVFRELMNHGCQVAQPHLRGSEKSHVAEGFRLETDWIIVKPVIKENTGNPAAVEHDPILRFRVRSFGNSLYIATQ